MNIDSFHITYNARHLKPEDVAKSFIFNIDFEELIQDNHTVLLGARGCGKTTLMKMLTLPAMSAWQHPNSETIKENISFNTVYISTDIYWNAQKDAYNRQLSKFPKYAEQVSKVAVTTNVLFALCETFQNIIDFNIKTRDQNLEVEFAKEIIKLWALPSTIPNIPMIKEALINRTDLLNRHIQKTVFNNKTEESIKIDDEYFNLDYDTSALNAIMFFERIFSYNKIQKWALCFDELELAPEWLQERLFASLRSRNQKILYKLSASPIVSISKDMLASSRNDFKLIKMWPHEKNSGYLTFVEALVKSLLFSKFNEFIEPDAVFGSSPILKKEKDNYKEKGESWNEIKKLAKTDEELRNLLITNEISPDNPIVKEDNLRKLDTVLRKIKPIVYFRNYYSYLDEKTGKVKARSRKAHTLFHGKEVLYKICDGNPRWLIGIVNEMLKGQENGKLEKIPEAKQAAVFENIAEQFCDIVKAIPEAIVQRKKGFITLYGILEEIGQYFFNEIVIGKFQRDPHSTFIIDENVSQDLIKILEKGVYQGAIILNNPSENSFEFEMKGKSFKLSYLLSAKFKIPIRKYSTISLSKILSGKETISYQQANILFDIQPKIL